MRHDRTQVLIVGGGTGGSAAALAAADAGCRVIVTEPTHWLGGQMTSQAVPPDEHPWIESHGCTRRYRQWRGAVRQYYRDHYPLTTAARQDPRLNPGLGFVSGLCAEPRVYLAALEQMLAAHRSSGRVRVMFRCRPVAVDVQGDRVRAVTVEHLDTGAQTTIEAPFVIDATELGDLLPLARAEYVSGAESQAQTQEPHAPAQANPDDVQAVSWCFPLAFDPEPGADHTIDKPAQYERWRQEMPRLTPPWPGAKFSFTMSHPRTLEPLPQYLFEQRPGPDGIDYASYFRFRQITHPSLYPPESRPHPVCIVNWPMIDYWEGNLIDQAPAVEAQRLEECRQLSLSWMYWMQTQAPRIEDGGQGYPGLYLVPDMVGSADGLAQFPYIRESRRIRALFTVTENHVGTQARQQAGLPAGAESFDDSVGVGCYRIDLHPSTASRNYVDISSLPYQIPLGALLPVRLRNLLPACKNIGVTHITNGCYRLHPTEWNIGESVGALAAFCLAGKLEPRQVRQDTAILRDFQRYLTGQGIELAWPATHPV
jgi:hypothetical protein